MSIFGLTLRKLREGSELSLGELAQKLSVSRNFLSNIESGYLEPSSEFTEQVANFFDVPQNYLTAEVGGIEPAFLPKGYCCINVFSTQAVESGILRESDVLDKIVVHTSDEHEDYIAVPAKNNLLSASRIHTGDTLVISRRSIADNGDICLISFPDKSVDFRKIYRDGTKITLFTDSIESNLPPVTYDISNSEYKILGKVVRLIANL